MDANEIVESHSEKLANFVVKLRFEDLPPEVVEKAKLHIMDSLALAVAATTAPWAKSVINVVAAQGGTRESTVIGTGFRLPASAAALANGTLVHSLDFDDTYLPAPTHISAAIVPAAIAMAESCNANGKAFMTATVAGFETMTRTALAGLNKFPPRGFHTASLLGVFGAAAASGKLLGLNAERLTSALGIAGSMASGILQTHIESTELKTLHPGLGAQGGIMATLLSKGGVNGPRQVFEGEQGFYRAFLGDGNYDTALLSDGLGSRWETLRLSFKMHQGGHGAHFFIESAMQVQREHGLRIEDIEEIRCRVSHFRANAHFEPREIKYRPPNTYIARFSLPYLIAVSLTYGHVGLDAFEEDKIHDPILLALAQKVTYEDDPKAVAPPHLGHVTVKTTDGRSFDKHVTVLRGTPENPATRGDIEAKFTQTAGLVLPAAQVKSLAKAIRGLESLPDLKRLMRLMRVKEGGSTQAG